MANNSILTNPEALVALRNLERTNTLLGQTQDQSLDWSESDRRGGRCLELCHRAGDPG